jgi:hypothetical protein
LSIQISCVRIYILIFNQYPTRIFFGDDDDDDNVDDDDDNVFRRSELPGGRDSCVDCSECSGDGGHNDDTSSSSSLSVTSPRASGDEDPAAITGVDVVIVSVVIVSTVAGT